MAIKNSQSKRMALANMLKQNATKNQRMASYMSPTGAARANQGQLRDGGYNNMLPYSSPASVRPDMINNTYNPSAQPTGPTGLTSNFYDPSYGIDRGFADQMTARNKAMQGMDSGQIQYDPVNKSFFSVGARGQRGGPALQGTYDQMYRKYDVQNQLRGLGTPSSLTPMQQAGVAQAGTNPFNAAQIDFMNKNQDVFGPYSSPSNQNANKLQAEKTAQVSQGGLSQLNTPNRPLRLMQGDDSSSVGGKIQQPMPSTGMPKISDGDFVDPIRSFNNRATPAPNTQVKSAGAAALGQPTQAQSVRPQLPPPPNPNFSFEQFQGDQQQMPAYNGPTQAQSVRPPLGGRYVNSGKVNQPMPSTGYPKINEAGFGDARGYANNGVTSANIGQATQSYPKQSQAPARRPVNRGKLNQLMPTPGV